MGQRPRAQPFHRRGDRDAGHAVDHPDRLGSVPGATNETEIIAILVGGRLLAVSSQSQSCVQRPGRQDGAPVRSRSRLRNVGGCRRSTNCPRRGCPLNRGWLFVLRAYLVLAGGLVLVRIVSSRHWSELNHVREPRANDVLRRGAAGHFWS